MKMESKSLTGKYFMGLAVALILGFGAYLSSQTLNNSVERLPASSDVCDSPESQKLTECQNKKAPE